MKKIFTKLLLVLLLISFGCTEKELIDENKEPSLKAAVIMTESMVSSKFGKPNSTYYYFQVYDISGVNKLSVKLYERVSGSTTYLPMTRSGTLWILSTKITNNGWYDWRYVYSVNKANISGNAYVLCNTYNTFNSGGISYIRWPFGADGSSWITRTVLINGISQSWIGGNEPNAPGNGFGQGSHTVANGDYYGDDWNRGTGSQDLGAELRSPLDGEVFATGTYNTDYGTSKYVSVTQEASDGKLYRFFFGHMATITITAGTKVRAGVTKLGTLGMSGANSPHAHCSIRNITGGGNVSVAFRFNAQ